MEILGKQISKNCEIIFSKIMSESKCKIIFSSAQNGENFSQEIGVDLFKIVLDISLPDKYFEELLLHECIHILQTKLGYRDMDISYDRKIAVYTNNVIMDIDVNRRLRNNYNYIRDNNYAQTILISKITKEIERMSNNPKQITNDDKKVLGLSLAFLDICYINKYKTMMHLALSTLCPEVLMYQRKFVEIVQSHPDTNYKTVHQIQNLSIDLFDL